MLSAITMNCVIASFFFRLNWQVMASYTVNEVVDMLWNESGEEEDISGDEFDETDEAYVGESESSDHDSSSSSDGQIMDT